MASLRSFFLAHKRSCLLVGVISVCSLAGAYLAQEGAIDGITFAGKPGELYLPARMLRTTFAQDVQRVDRKTVSIGGQQLVAPKRLLDGTMLVRATDLRELGAEVEWDPVKKAASIHWVGNEALVKAGDKRVFVDKSVQQLKAYQGKFLVLQSKISSGKTGHRTPSGSFVVDSKERMHYSRLYDNAPMPYAVHIVGNIFIHGYSSVPNYAASHGCIRMPLGKSNAAQWFYEWVDRGTPTVVSGDWVAKARSKKKGHRKFVKRHRLKRMRLARL